MYLGSYPYFKAFFKSLCKTGFGKAHQRDFGKVLVERDYKGFYYKNFVVVVGVSVVKFYFLP
jgi:hypothetical protein